MVSKKQIFRHARSSVALALSLLTSAPAFAADTKCGCVGELTPLPLEAKTSQDLAFKGLVERHYLIVNLLTSGRAAQQRNDEATALKQWESLAAVRDLPDDIQREVQIALAQLKPGAQNLPTTSARVDNALAVDTPVAHAKPKLHGKTTATVEGRVMGGGARGPGYTVVWLKPLDRPMPPLRPVNRTLHQRNKSFSPHVVAVPVGGRIAFVNDDDIHHNVFSAAEPNDFDSGLYGKGGSFGQVFNKPGPVEILCNIHANMGGYVYVVDSPYYAVANSSGRFQIQNVPTGRYRLEAWHEASTKTAVQTVTVEADNAAPVLVTVAGDKAPRGPTPDKYGHPRQEHIGY